MRGILNDLRGAPPSAIVLFSDGINTEGESLADAADYARRKGVPLFTVALGNERPNRDLVVSDLLVDDVVFVDDMVNFEFKLTGHGFAQKRVEVVLREKSNPAPLAKTTVTVGADGEAQKVVLPYRPTTVGEFEYVVEVPGLPDEAQADNNRQERLVSVRKDQIRVLLAQAYPNYEFRYLKHLLERDSTIELHTVLQEADPAYAEIDKSALRSFPVRRDELFKYDVVIFGDVNPALIGPGVMRNLADFVTEKGGGLVFISGPRFTPAGLSRHAAGRRCCRWSSTARRPVSPSPAARRDFRSCPRSWAWPARPCNWATRRSRRARFGATCRRCTGCLKSRS